MYSKTLENVSSARTRLERAFDPDAVHRMKHSAERDLSVGGPVLAPAAPGAGLVAECCLFLAPAVVGGGTCSSRRGSAWGWSFSTSGVSAPGWCACGTASGRDR